MCPRISVFTPVYNDSSWLPGAIESVLSQDHDDWEMVIGDNASTEPIADLVARYDDPRVRYVRFDRHVGIYENFNRTAASTRYEWLQVLCADDRLRPGCLRRIAGAIEGWSAADGELAMVLTACRRVDPAGRSADRTWYGSKPILDLRSGVYDGDTWLRLHLADAWPPWNVGSLAVSRTMVEDSGGFFRPEVGLSSDLELSLRASAYGRVVYIDEPLLDFMVRSDADSSTRLLTNRSSGDPRTPVGAALAHAYSVHAWQRPIAPDLRRAVKTAIARTHLQRAAQHRVLPGGLGRRGAISDVAAALRTSPRTVVRPYHLAYSIAAIGAPTAVLAAAQRRLAARHAGGSRPRRERTEPAGAPDPGATRH